MEALDLAKYAGYALGAYTVLLFGAEALMDLTRRIYSQEELESVVKIEAEKLGMRSDNIDLLFRTKEDPDYKTLYRARCCAEYWDCEKGDYVFSPKDSDKDRIIEEKSIDLKEGYDATRGVVRHELYHLHRHCPKKTKSRILNFLKAFFYEEPTATLYALTGIKL